MRVKSLMFHHFHDDRHFKCNGSLNAEEFEEIILSIGLDNIMSAREWCDLAERGKLGANQWCITFDDALKSQYDIALPVLNKYGLTAVWFIYTGPIVGEIPQLEIFRKFRSLYYPDNESYYREFHAFILSSEHSDLVQSGLKLFEKSDHLKEYSFYSEEDRKYRYLRDKVLSQDNYRAAIDGMIKNKGVSKIDLSENLWLSKSDVSNLHSEGHVIGLHSHTHPTTFSSLPVSLQKQEYEKNKEILESIVEVNIEVMSHPSNSYDNKTLELLSNMGIKVGFRSDWFVDYKSSLELPRIDHTLLNDIFRVTNKESEISSLL